MWENLRKNAAFFIFTIAITATEPKMYLSISTVACMTACCKIKTSTYQVDI
jgi:hypothetical protein